MLEGLALARMVDNVTVMRDVFLATIKLYNVLSPQFDVVAFKNGVVDFGTNRTDPQVSGTSYTTTLMISTPRRSV